mgnify:CR=1 FL=1
MNQSYCDKIEARREELQTLLLKTKADLLELELNERRGNFKIRKKEKMLAGLRKKERRA